MKKLLFVFFLAAVVLAACNSYGDKVMINDKSEVYYKGDGVTAADAQKLGEFLLKNNYFDTISKKSVQLTKTTDTFNVKFVVDKAKIETQKNADFLFQIMGTAISSEVFGNKPVKVVLADERMKAFKDVPMYNTEIPAITDTSAEARDTTGGK